MRRLIPILFFTLIGVYYLAGITPDMTWVSQAGDSFDYVIGAENMWAVRPTGYPVFILIGWLFERLPFNPFWNLALLSAVSSLGASIVIYKMVQYLVDTEDKFLVTFEGRQGTGMAMASTILSYQALHRVKNALGNPKIYAPYIAAATYAGSFLIWTQSIVPEVYTLTTFLSLLATYFALRGWWYRVAIVLAVAVGTHHLIVFVVGPLFLYLWYQWRNREVRQNPLIFLGIMALGFVSYLQVILGVHGTETTQGMGTVASQSLGSIGFVLALPLWETGNRLLEALPIVLTGLGTSLLLLFFLRRCREVYLLGALAILPFGYYLFSNIPMWIVYAVPAFTFASVLVGIGAARFPYGKYASLFLAFPILLMALNLTFYDIGKTIDPEPTSAREFYEGLDTIPDGAIFYLYRWGEPWLETYYYSVEKGYRFSFMFEGELKYHYESYKASVEATGIVLPDDPACYGVLAKNGLYYTEWDNPKFLEDLQILNPEKEIYVVYYQAGETFEGETFSIGRYSPGSRSLSLIP